jgi:formylglycine-generating enzyme required for sulfatase activity
MQGKRPISPFLLPLFVLALTCITAAQANNIRVSNAGLSGRNLTNGFTLVQFNLSWENSWRYSNRTSINNWDAAWVFAKFRLGEENPIFSNVTLTNGSAVVNVSSTANLRVGMPVIKLAGGSTVPVGVVIASINSLTQITLSANITTTASNNQLEFQRIWEQAWLDNVGHNPGSGMTAEPGLLTPGAAYDSISNPALGAFIYRSGPGSGPINLTDARLRWNYRSNGLNDSAIIEIQVFAIEMVFVPQGAFFAGPAENNSITYLGSEARTALSFVQAGIPCDKEAPFRVNTVAGPTFQGVNAASNALNLGARGNTDLTATATAALAAGFPTGVGSFYAMKYELSQGNYREFLNTLTRTQQNTRTATALAVGTTAVTNRYVMTNTTAVTNRNGIRCDATVHTNRPIVFYNDLNANGTGNEAADGEWIACNFLSWMDGAAYLDWAGLRPMTELEFEKASRGGNNPVAFENAWGDLTLVNAVYTLTNAGTVNEQIGTNYSTAAGNAAYQATTAALAGPLRSGIFATASSTRKAAGASFWGIFELSGNLREQVVTTGNAAGRAFTGMHGNGLLSQVGHANVTAWPGLVSGEVTGATGAGERGGSWNDPQHDLEVANRVRATTAGATRTNTFGIRGLRTRACSLPPAPVLASSQTLFPYGSIQSFSVSGTGSHRWVVPADWDILSGQGTNQLTVMVGGLDGVLRVAEVNDCGAGEEASVALFTGTVCSTGNCASGGTVTEFVGDGCNGMAGKRYRVHTFSTVGQNTLTVTSPLSLEYLIIGGGGGSGYGGGGSGGFREGILFVNEGNYPVIIGAGGAAGFNNGQFSEALGITSSGGGGGALITGLPNNGGSGGGGAAFSTTSSPQTNPGGLGNVPTVLPTQGYNGGSGHWAGSSSVPGSGGGGGGAGAPGLSGAESFGRNDRGGNGGSGRQSIITGALQWYAGGGGGIPRYGFMDYGIPGLGADNFGGGGSHGGQGRNGVIIIRYLIETP